MKPVSIIVACDERGGIGLKGKIPWHIPEDLKHFKDTTMGGVCIMGRRTYQEILEVSNPAKKGSPVEPQENKPLLSGRQSFVLSRDRNFKPIGAEHKFELRQVIDSLPSNDNREIFVIGGEKLFIEALSWANKIYMTAIKGEYSCDRFFPIHFLTKNFKIESGKQLDELYFVKYIRK